MHLSQEKETALRENLSVAWADVVGFIRQLSHDLRNNLNAIELQAALLAESAKEPDVNEEVNRLRGCITEMGKCLQKLTRALHRGTPHLMHYGAADFMEDLQEQVAHSPDLQKEKIRWEIELGEEMLEIDPHSLAESVLELFSNAVQHERDKAPLSCAARVEAGRFVLELREPKQQFALSTKEWGREPLRVIGRGHYGLGLYRARSIIESQQGDLRAAYDPQTHTLISTITLPLLPNAA
jgi:K+-sensing histidine kinase KdpD